MATTTTPSANLDFDSIKAEIINFIKADPTFTDYNFQGSALNTLIDILALNTFNNAFLASASHAENFLDSAQRRASVVSRGTEMGYTPRSASCATAYVNITAENVTGTQVLLRGLKFPSSNENGNFNFAVQNDTSSTTSGANQVFTSVKLIEGTNVTNYFVANSSTNIRSIFTIPNQNIDTTTLKVYVRSSINAADRVEYSLAENVYELKSDSKVYFIQESYDGYFQIYFGNNVIGSQPVNGAVIDIDYFITTNYTDANDCKIFGFNGTIDSATSVDIVTTQAAYGGSYKEEIDSIKINAKKSNSAKERTVKPSDYELTLMEKFNFIKSVSVWGGEDNVPPVYGKVFMSIQPQAGYTISDAIKRDVLTPAIRKTNVMTVIPVFVDPDYLLVEFVSDVKFNAAKTANTELYTRAAIKTAISDYVTSVSKFNADFIQSGLTLKLAAISGVSGVNVAKRVGFRMAPLIAVKTNYTRAINNSIISGTIESTKFRVMSGTTPVSVTIKEIPGSDSTVEVSGVLQVIKDLGTYTSTGELIAKVGTVNLSTGTFNIAINVLSYLSSNRFVQLSCELVSDDIISARNQILALDTSATEDVVIGLLDNNQVKMENYDR